MKNIPYYILAIIAVLVLQDAPRLAFGGLVVVIVLSGVAFVLFMRFMRWLRRKTMPKYRYFKKQDAPTTRDNNFYTPSQQVLKAANLWVNGNENDKGSFDYELKKRKEGKAWK